MAHRTLTKAVLFAFATISLALPASAQTAEEVKSDVLAAMSTPLPITVIGPLLTREITVTEEADGFRATLHDTSLMGLLPFGEVSIKLVVLDDNAYRITDLQFPKNLDFPGIAEVSFDDMTLDGIWSTTDRSYRHLNAAVSGLQVTPGHGDQGALTLGRLAFDVQKEPDETDTESRFDITVGHVAFSDASSKFSLREAKALLSANGDKPVDLYSVLREVIMVATMGGSESGAHTLAATILGNEYSTVGLDITISDISVENTQVRQPEIFEAKGLQAQVRMGGVTPRDWGMAELSVQLDQVKQQGMLDENAFDVEHAMLRLRGTELPVADFIAAIDKLETANEAQPLRVTDLLDGFLEFSAFEVTTQGEALRVEVRGTTFEEDALVTKTLYTTGFDGWDGRFALEGFKANEGVTAARMKLKGGTFLPGPDYDKDDLRHVRAWFPKQLSFGGRVSNLNEAFLKQVFEDVTIQNLDEPIELALPLLLYASASVFETEFESNRYETALFALEQSGGYRTYPAKVMSFAPVEGQITTQIKGLDALSDYVTEVQRDGRDQAELSALKSALIVMRNLGTTSADGTVRWDIAKPDVDRAEIVINGTTLHYPEISQFMPLMMFGMY